MAFRNPVRSLPSYAITGQLSADQVAAVNASALVGKVTSAQIQSVTAGQMIGQFTADQIASVSAAAISGQLQGTQLAADSIDGKTITGALVRTSSSGARWELGRDASSNANTLIGYTGSRYETLPGQLYSVGIAGQVAGDCYLGLLGPAQTAANKQAAVRLIGSPDGSTNVQLDADTISLTGKLSSTADVDTSQTVAVGSTASTVQRFLVNRKQADDGSAWDWRQYMSSGVTPSFAVQLRSAGIVQSTMYLTPGARLQLTDNVNAVTRYVPLLDTGSSSIGAIANGGTLTVNVTFATGRFTGTPNVFAVTDSARLTVACTARSTTGATFVLNNWSGASSVAGLLMWAAIQE